MDKEMNQTILRATTGRKLWRDIIINVLKGHSVEKKKIIIPHSSGVNIQMYPFVLRDNVFRSFDPRDRVNKNNFKYTGN